MSKYRELLLHYHRAACDCKSPGECVKKLQEFADSINLLEKFFTEWYPVDREYMICDLCEGDARRDGIDHTEGCPVPKLQELFSNEVQN